MDFAPHVTTSQSPQLEAFRTAVLEDPSLQEQLRAAGDGDDQKFIAAVLNLGRERGFALAAADVQGSFRERMLDVHRPFLTGSRSTPPPPAGWLPIRAAWQDGELYANWAHFGARSLRDPFFEGEVNRSLSRPFNRLFAYLTPLDKLAEWLDAHAHLRPDGFIFHMSRCGSTLVSQMLAALPSNISISEASPIDAVIQARHWRPDLDEERQARWLASIVGAFGQQRSGAERNYFIKLDCWHTAALPLLRRVFPDVPWVFLFRDPVEVIVSHLRMPGAQMVPRGIGPDLYGIERSYGSGTTEDYYARVLAKVVEPVMQHYSAGGGLLVNYSELPDAFFAAILPHFGMACSTADRAAMADVARYDAKGPWYEFTPDSAAKQQEATAAVRAAAGRWAAPLYQELEALRAGR